MNLPLVLQAPADADVPEVGAGVGVLREHYEPLRTIADVEAIEQVPLEQRIIRWDFAMNLLDGCRADPSRAALHVTQNGNVDGEVLTWRFGELERRAIQVANLLRASGLGSSDVVAVVFPTVPGLFATMVGGLLAVRPRTSLGDIYK